MHYFITLINTNVFTIIVRDMGKECPVCKSKNTYERWQRTVNRERVCRACGHIEVTATAKEGEKSG